MDDIEVIFWDEVTSSESWGDVENKPPQCFETDFTVMYDMVYDYYYEDI